MSKRSHSPSRHRIKQRWPAVGLWDEMGRVPRARLRWKLPALGMLLASTAILGTTVAHASPITSVGLQAVPGEFGYSGTLTATPTSGTVSDPLGVGGSLSMSVTSGNLITITNTDGGIAGVNGEITTHGGTPSGDTQGWLGSNSAPANSGTFPLLQSSYVDQVWFGQQTVTGTLTFSEAGYSNRTYTFNDPGNGNINNIVEFGGADVDYLSADGLGQPASLIATGEGANLIYVSGNLTETDTNGDSAILGWAAGSFIDGSNPTVGAIDPPGPVGGGNPPQPVSEPGTLALLGIGLIVLGWVYRTREKHGPGSTPT